MPKVDLLPISRDPDFLLQYLNVNFNRIVDALEGGGGGAGSPAIGIVNTEETTSSLTYANLATVGPSVTVTTTVSGLVLVIGTAALQNSIIGGTSHYSWALSGPINEGASDDFALSVMAGSANQLIRASALHLHSGLSPGTYTFTAKYRVSTDIGTFRRRTLIAIPL